MEIGQLRDDGAVPPIFAVAVVATIAVILAATSAVFVFGLGERAENAPPQVNFTYEYSQAGHGELMLNLESGDSLDPAQIGLAVSNGKFHPAPGNRTSPSGPAYESLRLDSDLGDGNWVRGDVEAGMEFGIVGESSDSLERMTVRVVWYDPTGNRTVSLSDWQGPDVS